MDNVCECDFSEVEPSASALVFLAVSFRLPAMGPAFVPRSWPKRHEDEPLHILSSNHLNHKNHD